MTDAEAIVWFIIICIGSIFFILPTKKNTKAFDEAENENKHSADLM